MATLKEIAEKILDITNGGLDIIQTIYPQADTRKKFRIRDNDKTESTDLKFFRDINRWKLTDFGGIIKNEDAFGLYAIENGLSYQDSILDLGREYESKGYNIFEKEQNIFKYKFREFERGECPFKLNEKDFFYEEKPFTEDELKTLGNFVKKEHCEKVGLISLKSYAYFNKEKQKVFQFISTEKFPIFGFINHDKEIGDWLKIYMPRASKKYSEDGKDRRFRYIGGKPFRYVFGLDYVKNLYTEGLEKAKNDFAKTNEIDILQVKDSDVNFKLESICIATGGSDGLNLLSLGQPAIWFNSESEKADSFLIIIGKTKSLKF